MVLKPWWRAERAWELLKSLHSQVQPQHNVCRSWGEARASAFFKSSPGVFNAQQGLTTPFRDTNPLSKLITYLLAVQIYHSFLNNVLFWEIIFWRINIRGKRLSCLENHLGKCDAIFISPNLIRNLRLANSSDIKLKLHFFFLSWKRRLESTHVVDSLPWN